mmetsp:Transcript_105937/g.188414  ORF Transcript_105937/g.188414 Transcript_105937/m.188414 type:complete len:269 (-) Transcript_105937:1661-2467(-)
MIRENSDSLWISTVVQESLCEQVDLIPKAEHCPILEGKVGEEWLSLPSISDILDVKNIHLAGFDFLFQELHVVDVLLLLLLFLLCLGLSLLLLLLCLLAWLFLFFAWCLGIVQQPLDEVSLVARNWKTGGLELLLQLDHSQFFQLLSCEILRRSLLLLLLLSLLRVRSRLCLLHGLVLCFLVLGFLGRFESSSFCRILPFHVLGMPTLQVFLPLGPPFPEPLAGRQVVNARGNLALLHPRLQMLLASVWGLPAVLNLVEALVLRQGEA